MRRGIPPRGDNVSMLAICKKLSIYLGTIYIFKIRAYIFVSEKCVIQIIMKTMQDAIILHFRSIYATFLGSRSAAAIPFGIKAISLQIIMI